MTPESWDRVIDVSRLRTISDGIVGDARCVEVPGQHGEKQFRDSVAASCLGSREDAVRVATGHHSKGVMLRRAADSIRDVAARFREEERVVIDLGSGFGWHWIDLAATYPSVRFVLVDFSLANLEVCRSLMPLDRYPNVLCVQATITDLPVTNAVASLVWSVQVLQHLPAAERNAALREARRILSPGGAFYIAWLRAVPAVRTIFALLGKRYHLRGQNPQGLHLDRFDDSIRENLRALFPSGHVSHSEAFFHPELRLRPSGEWTAAADLAVSKTPLGKLFARQAEFRGCI